MQSDFDLPSVDDLIEGVDYTELTYDFAQRCPKGMWKDAQTRLCRDKNMVAASRKARGERRRRKRREVEKVARAVKGVARSAKYGWAKRKGKPILVEWKSKSKG